MKTFLVVLAFCWQGERLPCVMLMNAGDLPQAEAAVQHMTGHW
ncbi:hypothetical protein ACI2I2_24255 [Scandinavium sp. NPDC088450]